MSRTRLSRQYFERDSTFKGNILRALIANNLPETMPEKKGLVNRERLLEFVGRGRKLQIAPSTLPNHHSLSPLHIMSTTTHSHHSTLPQP